MDSDNRVGPPARVLAWMLCVCVAAVGGCGGDDAASRKVAASSRETPAATTPRPASPPLVAAARAQIGVTRYYDPAYVQLAYPGGDVPSDRGVCTDVIVRAFRQRGLDLQQAVHEDMRGHFGQYPRDWGARTTDRNIDHRRVPNLMRWFERQRWQQPASAQLVDFQAGDIVAWKLRDSGLLHIGLVSDARGYGGVPLIIHNIGAGTQEDDILFAHTIIGHYRAPSRY